MELKKLLATCFLILVQIFDYVDEKTKDTVIMQQYFTVFYCFFKKRY